MMKESNPLQTFTSCRQTSNPEKCSNGASFKDVVSNTHDSRSQLVTPKPTYKTRLHVDISKISDCKLSRILPMNVKRSSFERPSVVRYFTCSTLSELIFMEIILTLLISSWGLTERPSISCTYGFEKNLDRSILGTPKSDIFPPCVANGLSFIKRSILLFDLPC